MTKVRNMESTKGNLVPNQFVIHTNDGVYFQSYQTIIAFVPFEGKIELDARMWDYSRTTGKYRNLFLMETKGETEKKIADGTYILTDLNKKG